MSLTYFLSEDLVHEVGHANWEGLSVMPEKKEFYTRDVYFREAWSDAISLLKENAVPLLQRIAILVLKPDAFMARKSHLALSYLYEKGFHPIHWKEFRYNRWTMREDWRYQLNQFSLERIFLNEKLLTSADCTMIVLRDISDDISIPATVRLQSLKGNSLPELHKPGQLRAILNSKNRLFKFVHTTDEPADILRELGIIYTSDDRRSFFNEISRNFSNDRSIELADYLTSKSELFELNEFDWKVAIEELEIEASRCENKFEAICLAKNIKNYLDAGNLKSEVYSARNLFREFSRLKINISNTSFMSICTHLIHHSYALEYALMRGDGLHEWLAGKGKLFSIDKSNVNL